MKVSLVAVFEPSAASRKKISVALAKAGLKVTSAQLPSALAKEQLVVLGPSVKDPAKVARAARASLKGAVVLAAQAKGFKASWADAVLPLPVSPNDLKVRLPELLAAKPTKPAKVAAPPPPRPGEGILDPFTGFYTFAHFKEVLFIEVKRARRYGIPLSIALVDFDPLPRGLSAALRLQRVGGLSLAIRRSLRDTDYPVQYGSDHVLLLMPHTDLQGALVVSRRICERVGKATLSHGEEVLHPTLSIGVAAGSPGRDYGFSDLTRQAQESLAAARAAGGNRVEFFDLAASSVTEGVPFEIERTI